MQFEQAVNQQLCSINNTLENINKLLASQEKRDVDTFFIAIPESAGLRQYQVGTTKINLRSGTIINPDGTIETFQTRLENTIYTFLHSLSIFTDKDITLQFEGKPKQTFYSDYSSNISFLNFYTIEVVTTETTNISLFMSSNPLAIISDFKESTPELLYDLLANIATRANTLTSSALVYNINTYFDNNDSALILNHSNLLSVTGANILNNTNLTASRAAQISNNINLTLAKAGSIYNDVALPASRAATILNTIADIPVTRTSLILDNANLTAAKGAEILNHTNLTVANAASIMNDGGLTDAKNASMLDNTTMIATRAASICDDANFLIAKLSTSFGNANLTNAKATTIYNSMARIVADVATMFNNISASKTATILNGTSKTKANSASVLDSTNIAVSKVDSILTDGNITDANAQDIVTLTTRDWKTGSSSSIITMWDDWSDNKISGRDSANTTASGLPVNTFAQKFRPTWTNGSASGGVFNIIYNGGTPSTFAVGTWEIKLNTDAIDATVNYIDFDFMSVDINNYNRIRLLLYTTKAYQLIANGLLVINAGDPGFDTAFHTYKVTRTSGGNFELFFDGISKGTGTDNNNTSSVNMIFFGTQGHPQHADNLKVF